MIETIKNMSTHATSHCYIAMGTTIALCVYGSQSTDIIKKTVELISHYEDLLTVNRNHSEVMEINNASGIKEMQVSSGTYSLIKRAINESHGAFGFNALIGPVVKLWHIGFPDAHVPSDSQIKEKLSLTNLNDVKMDDCDQTVFLAKKGMELDLGGIAKGWIADRIKELWLSYGVTSGVINLGGNILFVGDSPESSDGNWIVDIQDPFKQIGSSITTVMTPSCSVVTSGIYRRCFTANNHRYHHIIDPKTGYPVRTHLLSVTVFTRESIQAEIECKRLLFSGKPIKNWIKSTDHFGAIFVYTDGHIIYDGLGDD